MAGLLLRELREQKFPVQKEFAQYITTQLKQLADDYKGKVKQSSVSRVEGLVALAKTTICEGKLPRRQDLLRVMLVGLKLDINTTSLLLAFIQGDAFKHLTLHEIQNNLGRLMQPIEISQSRQWGEDINRTHFAFIQLFEKILNEKLLSKERVVRDVVMHHRPDVQDPLTLSRIIYNYEKRPGQFMRLTKYPAFTVLPQAADKYFVQDLEQIGRPDINVLNNAFHQRRLLSNSRMLSFGERNIHSYKGLERYAKRSLGHHLPVSLRRRHLFNLIRLLKSYPNQFRVGLAPDEIETELLINCTRWVLLRPTSYHHILHEDSYHAGPSFLYWTNPLSVMRTQLEFEDCWQRLSSQGLTEPENVSQQITAILREVNRLEPEKSDEEWLTALDDLAKLKFELSKADYLPDSFFCEQIKLMNREEETQEVNTEEIKNQIDEFE